MQKKPISRYFHHVASLAMFFFILVLVTPSIVVFSNPMAQSPDYLSVDVEASSMAKALNEDTLDPIASNPNDHALCTVINTHNDDIDDLTLNLFRRSELCPPSSATPHNSGKTPVDPETLIDPKNDPLHKFRGKPSSPCYSNRNRRFWHLSCGGPETLLGYLIVANCLVGTFCSTKNESLNRS